MRFFLAILIQHLLIGACVLVSHVQSPSIFFLDIGVALDANNKRSGQCSSPCVTNENLDSSVGVNFFNHDVASDQGMKLKITVKPKISSNGQSGMLICFTLQFFFGS